MDVFIYIPVFASLTAALIGTANVLANGLNPDPEFSAQLYAGLMILGFHGIVCFGAGIVAGDK